MTVLTRAEAELHRRLLALYRKNDGETIAISYQDLKTRALLARLVIKGHGVRTMYGRFQPVEPPFADCLTRVYGRDGKIVYEYDEIA